MRLWLDDIREMPENCTHHAKSVNEAKLMVLSAEEKGETIECLDLDHDLGDYATEGGDAICLLDWLVERNTLYPVVFHTANPVGRANMQRIVNRWWPK